MLDYVDVIKFYPKISASRRPTLSPLLTSSEAKLTATVLLPTPPCRWTDVLSNIMSTDDTKKENVLT